MSMKRAVWTLGRIDAKGIARDTMLRWVLVLPILIALLTRWAVPAITTRIEQRLAFDLFPYYSLIASFLLLFMPMMIGVVIGFLLLDERDDGTLTALQVTPLNAFRYLAYRISAPMLTSIIITSLIVPLTGLVKTSILELFLAGLCAAPLAPIYAIFLATFAQNKVQGFALAKVAGIVFWPSVFAYFIGGWWQLLFGIFPTFWPMKYFWMADQGAPGAGWYVIGGLGYEILLLAVLLRRFNLVTRR